MFIALLLSLNLPSHAANNEVTGKYKHQLQLIDSIRKFIRTDLKLDIPEKFYTEWSKAKDSMYVMLYCSKGNKIERPDSNYMGGQYYDDENEAVRKSHQLDAMGYQTLVYKTAGMANDFLSRKLLSYPDEAIAFILFHEATHNDLRRANRRYISYNYEEALCDAVANYACLRFAIKTKLLDPEGVKRQTRIFETIYRYLNKERKIVDDQPADKNGQIFKTCTFKIAKWTEDANQFQKDRMNYEVNNAYFLRIDNYATHYFEIKKMLDRKLDVDSVIDKLWQYRSKAGVSNYTGTSSYPPLDTIKPYGTPLALPPDTIQHFWQWK